MKRIHDLKSYTSLGTVEQYNTVEAKKEGI